jgi:hypothetical protein
MKVLIALSLLSWAVAAPAAAATLTVGATDTYDAVETEDGFTFSFNTVGTIASTSATYDSDLTMDCVLAQDEVVESIRCTGVLTAGSLSADVVSVYDINNGFLWSCKAPEGSTMSTVHTLWSDEVGEWYTLNVLELDYFFNGQWGHWYVSESWLAEFSAITGEPSEGYFPPNQ